MNIHNPFLDNVVVQRNVANIPETNNEHHVERREIFGEDDRDEVSREHVPIRVQISRGVNREYSPMCSIGVYHIGDSLYD